MTTAEKHAFTALVQKPTSELLSMQAALDEKIMFDRWSKQDIKLRSSLNVILAQRALYDEMIIEADQRFPEREVAFDKHQIDFRIGTQVLWVYQKSDSHAGGKRSLGTVERGYKHATDG